MRLIYSLLLKMTGWKIRGGVPDDLKKYIVLVAPHTSNWDFFLAIAVRSVQRMDTKYLAKKELFRFPFGVIFRALGGYPVDRSKRTNFVDAVADLFNDKEVFSIAITPEGTRKHVEKLKTGFYYIAKKANVPVVYSSLNYEKKEVIFEPAFHVSESVEEELNKAVNYFSRFPGRNPENGIRPMG